MGKPFVQPFRTGDEVEVVTRSGRPRKVRDLHIIHEVNLTEEEYRYSTHRSAWHSHSSFKLVRECCEETMAKLRQSIQDEEDGDAEDYED